MTILQSKIDNFVANYPQETYLPNSPILTTGSPTTFFYFIVSGAVKMVTTSVKGRNLILHTFFPNSFFSLFSLITNGKNNYDFIAQLPTTVHKIPQAELVSFYKADPELLYDLQLRLIKGLSGLTKRVEQSALSTAYQQVASLLIYFAEHFSEEMTDAQSPYKQTKRIVVRITHQEMSEWLGLSRENVSIQMKLLEKNGLISISNRFIEITDLELLKKELIIRDTM